MESVGPRRNVHTVPDRERSQDPLFTIVPVAFPLLVPVPVPWSVNKALDPWATLNTKVLLTGESFVTHEINDKPASVFPALSYGSAGLQLLFQF